MMTANYSRKWMMAGLLAFSALYLPSHGTAQWTGRYEPQQGSPNGKYAFGKYPLDRRFLGWPIQGLFRNLALGYVENLGYTRGIARLP